MFSIVKFHLLDEQPHEIVQIIESRPRWGKNYLVLAKPKSQYKSLTCSIQMKKQQQLSYPYLQTGFNSLNITSYQVFSNLC